MDCTVLFVSAAGMRAAQYVADSVSGGWPCPVTIAVFAHRLVRATVVERAVVARWWDTTIANAMQSVMVKDGGMRIKGTVHYT
jgi:hypothetical protein